MTSKPGRKGFGWEGRRGAKPAAKSLWPEFKGFFMTNRNSGNLGNEKRKMHNCLPHHTYLPCRNSFRVFPDSVLLVLPHP